MDPMEEREDRAILAALEMLETDGREALEPEEVRPWVEVLGLLPSEMDTLPPSETVLTDLMERITPQRSSDDNVAEFDGGRSAPRNTQSPWMLRLAAVLTLALLGFSVKQGIDLADRDRQIETQTASIEHLRGQIAEIADALPAGQSLPDWMVASGTELCELRPRAAGAEGSRGWLFVRNDHQHWVVSVQGLSPTPEGQIYELWFMVDGEPFSGGRFQPDATGQAVLTSETMPTGITGIAVTLQPLDGDGQPSDSTVLFGDEVMLTL
jgi:hypothetical protein